MLEKAIEIINGQPFLIGFTQSRYITLVFDGKGKIIWALNTGNRSIYSEAIHYMLGRDIGEFYDIGRGKALSEAGRVPEWGAIAGYYRGKDPNRDDFFWMRMETFPSRNVFESRFAYLDFRTDLPISGLKIIRLFEGCFLGVIIINDRILRFLERQNDINVLLDENQNLAGYDRRFRRLAGKAEPELGAPIARYIADDFLRPALPPPPGAGKRLFSFPGEAGIEFSPPGLFKVSGDAIACDTGRSPVPAFFRLPAPFDLSQPDFRLDVECRDIVNAPPLCIVNSRGLSGTFFPDEDGLMFARFLPAHEHNETTAFFALRHQGENVAVFRDFLFPRSGALGPVTLTIVREGADLRFYADGRALGAYPAGEAAGPPGPFFIVLGLRPGSACRFTKIALTRPGARAGNAGPGAAYVTHFPGSPGRLFKVLPFYFDFNEVPLLCYLRLEDLDAREQIRRLNLEKKDREAQIHRLRQGLFEYRGMDRIVGESPAMKRLKETLLSVTAPDVPVLLTGETGTGKSMVARALHETGPRRDGPFIKADCASLPASLMESELFGHEKGAFTGAVQAHRGKFEQAQGGTVFLDEIGNLGQDVQAKLLNVLQDRRIQRLGGTEAVPLDFRLISATNQDLDALIARGAFRSDLFYRLNVLHLHIPPLRERAEDVPLLCEYFMNTGFQKLNTRVVSIDPAVYDPLMGYAWPGNVRELYNVLLKSVVLCKGPELKKEDVLPNLPHARAGSARPQALSGPGGRRKRVALDRILEEIRACGGNVRSAASALGVSRFTVYNKLKKAGLKAEEMRT